MRIPGETAAYRAARDRLLEAEARLRAEVEAVAAARRGLPEGPPPLKQYRFAMADGRATDLAGLMGPDRPALFFYCLMFAPDEGQGACPMCCAFLDSLDGAAPHIGAHVALAVGAKATPAQLAGLQRDRGWRHLRLVSTGGTSFNRDYGAETEAGGQLPMALVWRRAADGPRVFWASELFHHASDWPHHPRHVDMMWPLWNVLDVTPGGRGAAVWPRLSYD